MSEAARDPYKLPRNFGRWTGPWSIGITADEEGWERLWIREYREKSHCGTPGCCEDRGLVAGPVLSEGEGQYPEWSA